MKSGIKKIKKQNRKYVCTKTFPLSCYLGILLSSKVTFPLKPAYFFPPHFLICVIDFIIFLGSKSQNHDFIFFPGDSVSHPVPTLLFFKIGFLSSLL